MTAKRKHLQFRLRTAMVAMAIAALVVSVEVPLWRSLAASYTWGTTGLRPVTTSEVLIIGAAEHLALAVVLLLALGVLLMTIRLGHAAVRFLHR